MVVDPDGTELEHPAGSHSLEDVLCPDGSRQTIDHIVGLCQHFFLGFETTDNDNGTEHLVLHYLCIVAVLSDNSGLEEEAFFETRDGGTLATGYDVCTRTQGTLDKTLNSTALGSRD